MSIHLEPIGWVENTRVDHEDDDWGQVQSRITLSDAFDDDALLGLDAFSHVEILFHFDRVGADQIHRGARHPRNNPAWPKIGIFAQRARKRPNRLGSTICKVIGVEGKTLIIEGLDAIHKTPILDIKPLLSGFMPREAVQEPPWAQALMVHYWEGSSNT